MSSSGSVPRLRNSSGACACSSASVRVVIRPRTGRSEWTGRAGLAAPSTWPLALERPRACAICSGQLRPPGVNRAIRSRRVRAQIRFLRRRGPARWHWPEVSLRHRVRTSCEPPVVAGAPFASWPVIPSGICGLLCRAGTLAALSRFLGCRGCGTCHRTIWCRWVTAGCHAHAHTWPASAGHAHTAGHSGPGCSAAGHAAHAAHPPPPPMPGIIPGPAPRSSRDFVSNRASIHVVLGSGWWRGGGRRLSRPSRRLCAASSSWPFPLHFQPRERIGRRRAE